MTDPVEHHLGLPHGAGGPRDAGAVGGAGAVGDAGLLGGAGAVGAVSDAGPVSDAGLLGGAGAVGDADAQHERTELLRRHGVQVTAQRLAVLRAVSERPHSTASEIGAAVRAEIGAISPQAVYDALGTLAEKGIIRRIQPAGSPARYEDRVGDNHHHLICRTCGRTVDIDCAVGDLRCLTPAEDLGFEIDQAEVIYWGRCPECVRRSSAGPNG